MNEIILRDYQNICVDRVREAFRTGARRVLLVMPCGAGKTIVFSYISKKIAAKEKKCCVIAHRKELIMQCSDKMKRFGVAHGIIKAGHAQQFWYNVQVASVQTLEKRLETAPKFKMITIDECHRSAAKTYQRVIHASPEALILGVTASPVFGNGRGLGNYYEAIVIGPSVKDLIADGFLVSTKVFAPPPVADLAGVEIVAGDYNKGQLDIAMRKRPITGDAIQHYKAKGNSWPAIVYVVSIAHATETAEQFREAGLNFHSIDGKMKDEQRDQLLKDFAERRIQGLVSCDLISEGTDIPSAQVAIKLRPTQSEGLDIQQNGRINRPLYAAEFDLDTRAGRLAAIAASPKPYAIVFDHVNNCSVHGLPASEREWSLDPGVKKKKTKGEKVERIVTCPKCMVAQDPAPKCYNCGHVFAPKTRKIKQVDGTLMEMTEEMIVAAKKKKVADLKACKTKPELIQFGIEHGYKRDGLNYWAEKILEQRQAWRHKKK